MNPALIWTIKIGVFLAAVAGLIYGHYEVGRLRQEVDQYKQASEGKPDQLFYEASLEAELDKHSLDIRRIEAYVPPREHIIDVIANIEAEGKSTGVEVTIAEIKEQLVLDTSGKPVKNTGILQDVAITIVATGEPKALLGFLYRIEHLPYVLHAASWHLSPQRGAPAAPSSNETEPAKQSKLETTIIMASRNETYEKTTNINE